MQKPWQDRRTLTSRIREQLLAVLRMAFAFLAPCFREPMKENTHV
jgi:hypothetical protein